MSSVSILRISIVLFWKRSYLSWTCSLFINILKSLPQIVFISAMLFYPSFWTASVDENENSDEVSDIPLIAPEEGEAVPAFGNSQPSVYFESLNKCM